MMVEMLKITPEVPIPAHLAGQVQSKLAYVDEAIAAASVAEDGSQITLTLRGESDTERLTAKVQQVVVEMAKGAMAPKVEVLEDHLGRSTPYSADPMPELAARGEVSEEHTGIFRACPHSLTVATQLREELHIINDFAEGALVEAAGLNTGMESFSRIQALLSPAVCYHLYFALADRELPSGQLTATAVGNCFRYESTNLSSLERLWNFTMREVIFVGSADFVLENREKARLHMREALEEMGLAYMVESANDPFFVGEFRRQASFQNAFQLKDEIRARLPFKDSTLAVGSYNYHQDFFGRHLNISLPDEGGPVHTGCVAFGLERMAYAFLAQYGLDPKLWPAAMRERMA